MTSTVVTSPKTAKASKVVVSQVADLIRIRAEILELERQKDALTAEIEKAFGVDKTAKTSMAETLIHAGIEFARLVWRTRKGVDLDKLETLYPEAYADCQKPIVYSVITALHR